MNLKFAVTLTLACATVAACSPDPKSNLAPGQYQSSTSSKDANGTAIDKTTSTNVTIDQNGNKDVDTSVKTTTDPKGLFNKTTSTSASHETYGQ